VQEDLLKFEELTGCRLVHFDDESDEQSYGQEIVFDNTLIDLQEQMQLAVHELDKSKMDWIEQVVAEYPTVEQFRFHQMLYYQGLEMYDQWERSIQATLRDMPEYVFGKINYANYLFGIKEDALAAKAVLADFDIVAFCGQNGTIRADIFVAWGLLSIRAALELDDRTTAKYILRLLLLSGQPTQIIEVALTDLASFQWANMSQQLLPNEEDYPMVEHRAEPRFITKTPTSIARCTNGALRDLVRLPRPTPANLEALLYLGPDRFKAEAIGIFGEVVRGELLPLLGETETIVTGNRGQIHLEHLLGLALYYQVHLDILPYFLDFLLLGPEVVISHTSSKNETEYAFYFACLRTLEGRSAIQEFLLLEAVGHEAKMEVVYTLHQIALNNQGELRQVVLDLAEQVFQKALQEAHPDFVDVEVLGELCSMVSRLGAEQYIPTIQAIEDRGWLYPAIDGDAKHLIARIESMIPDTTFVPRVNDVFDYFNPQKDPIADKLQPDLEQMFPNDPLEQMIFEFQIKKFRDAEWKRDNPD
jgi:hypothetical protein